MTDNDKFGSTFSTKKTIMEQDVMFDLEEDEMEVASS